MKGKLTLALIIAGTLLTTSCDTEARRAQREEATQLRGMQEKQRIENIYDGAVGLAHYKFPQIEITSKKENFSLDPFKHLGNEMKAQKIVVPVSQEYFNSVSVGQLLSEKFSEGGLFFEGEIATYKVSITKKQHGDMYCLISPEGWSEINNYDYYKLALVNTESLGMLPSENNPNVWMRDGYNNQLEDLFTESCDVVIESYKSNFTFDITKHITNEMNRMNYPLELPGFLCNEIEVGDILDKNFVGGSLLFSSSLSEVTY